jgi:hypothetical protein
MITMTISVTGSKELKQLLIESKQKVNEKLIEAIESGSIMIENEAREIAPVDTGFLRANITHVIEAEKSGDLKIRGKIGVRDIVKYAEAVEVMGIKGTGQPSKPGKKMPYLLPSFNKFITKINKMIADAVVDGLGKK